MFETISLSKSWKVQTPEVRHVYDEYIFKGVKRFFVSAVAGERDDRRNAISYIHPHWDGLVLAIPYTTNRRVLSSQAPVMLGAILPPRLANLYFSDIKVPTGYEEDAVFDAMEKRTFNDMIVVAHAALLIAAHQHPKYLSGTIVTKDQMKPTEDMIDPVSIYNVKGIVRNADNTLSSVTTRGILFSVKAPDLATEEISEDSLEIFDQSVIREWNQSKS